MTRTSLVLAGALLVASGVLGAQNAQLVEKGSQLYEAQGCPRCHQVDGKGSKLSLLDGVGSKLTADEMRQWLTDPDQMTATLPKKPVILMKKYALSDADLDALVAYLQTLTK